MKRSNCLASAVDPHCSSPSLVKKLGEGSTHGSSRQSLYVKPTVRNAVPDVLPIGHPKCSKLGHLGPEKKAYLESPIPPD